MVPHRGEKGKAAVCNGWDFTREMSFK
jgi:hypothetical protein